MDSNRDHKWTLADEGRLVRLLRDLAHCEQKEARAPLVKALREATGEDIGPEPGRWLAWYLEDHLAMRNVIALLAGREMQFPQNDQGPLLMDEQVFDRAEYNWCALERVENKDDMLKLKRLYSDLESPILVEAEGPFSFRRLTGLDDADLAYFRGKSLSEALFNDAVQVRHLRVLKDYGKMMMMPLFPSGTQRTGAMLYAASISRALVKYDTKITSLSFQDLIESLPGLIERPYTVERYRNLFQEALTACT